MLEIVPEIARVIAAIVREQGIVPVPVREIGRAAAIARVQAIVPRTPAIEPRAVVIAPRAVAIAQRRQIAPVAARPIAAAVAIVAAP